MREIQLQISNDAGVNLGVIDLENFKDFPLTLTKAIGDLNDFTQRKSDYSLDFDIPRTQNNNQVLFGVANVNGVNNTISLLGRRKCTILVDGNQISYGFIRIYESTNKQSYKANFSGGNGDWVSLLSNVYLNQLEWITETNSGTVDATETFDQARIDTVNGLDSDSVDIIYPYIIRDTVSGIDNRYLRPQLYVRSIIKRMFSKIGYTVNSAFIDSEFMKGITVGSEVYKGLTIDPSFIFENSDDTIQASRLEAITTTTTYPISNNVGESGGGAVRLNNLLTNYWDNEIQDTANAFNPVDSSYTAPQGGVFEVKLDFGNYRFEQNANGFGWLYYDAGSVNPTEKKPPSIIIKLVKNNVSTVTIDGDILSSSPISLLPTNYTASATLSAGDKLTTWIEIIDNAGGFTSSTFVPLNAPSLDKWRFWVGLDANLSVQPKSAITFGDEYSINSQLAKNVSCLDILQDLKNTFNLYFAPDFSGKSIAIEPRDDFYQNIGSSENITDMVDLSKSIIINSDRTYQEELVFKYATDSKDKYLDEWQKINNRIYGEYIHNFGTDYLKGKRTVQLKLIATTIQKVMEDENVVTSVIRREWEDDKEPLNVNSDYSMRMFQVVQSEQIQTDGFPRRTTAPTVVTVALMESYGNVPTYNDLRLTYNGTNGLFETYYAKTIANIEDKRQVDLYLKMPLYKFRNLDLSKPVYVDWSIPEIQGYYIFEQIKGYKLDEFAPVKVRLLRFKNYQPVAVDPSQKTNVNENTDAGQGETFEQIQYIFDEGLATESYSDVFDTNNSGSFLPLYYD